MERNDSCCSLSHVCPNGQWVWVTGNPIRSEYIVGKEKFSPKKKIAEQSVYILHLPILSIILLTELHKACITRRGTAYLTFTTFTSDVIRHKQLPVSIYLSCIESYPHHRWGTKREQCKQTFGQNHTGASKSRREAMKDDNLFLLRSTPRPASIWL